MDERRAAVFAAAAGALASLLAAAGCGPKKSEGPKPSPSPSVKSSPRAAPLEATVRDLDLLLTDPKGAPVAQIKAEAGSVGPGGAASGSAGYQGALRVGTATLYQEGKAAATLRADELKADQAKRTVTGRGNVVVRSLQSPESPAIRADEMTWRYDDDTVTGSGNVLVTRAPDLQVPASRFEADTRVRDFTLYGGGKPATGSF